MHRLLNHASKGELDIPSEAEGSAVLSPTNSKMESHDPQLVIPSEAEGSAVRTFTPARQTRATTLNLSFRAKPRDLLYAFPPQRQSESHDPQLVIPSEAEGSAVLSTAPPSQGNYPRSLDCYLSACPGNQAAIEPNTPSALSAARANACVSTYSRTFISLPSRTVMSKAQ